jgi:IstB-like ATP binding protein
MILPRPQLSAADAQITPDTQNFRQTPDWGEIFGDTVVAAAILDRLMHNAIVFNIRGPSWRLKEHDSLQIATTNPDQRSTR